MIRLLFLALLLLSHAAGAHHPGEQLDEVMAEQEPAFEVTDLLSLPDLDVEDRHGEPLRLGDLHDQIVILSFVRRGCGGPCSEQQAMLAAVQAQVNITPMKEMVTFVTVQGSDVSIEAPWDAANWRLAVPSQGRATAIAADRFASLSDRGPGVPMVHVLDRAGRHAGIFHGAAFRRINLTLYINGLINNAAAPQPPVETSWWDWLTDRF